jgi:hypothetical protein
VTATVPQDPETAPRIAGSATAVPAVIVPVAGMNATASIAEPGAGTSASGPATASAAAGEKKDEKKEDTKETTAAKASEEKKSEPVKKMYCN